MKTRIKTKQEFAKEGGPQNWNSKGEMEYLYGLPAEVSHRVIYPDLTDGEPEWDICDYHLTTAPHPYMDREWKVRVSNKAEWDMVDARCKAMGFSWPSHLRGRCEYDGHPGIFIREGLLSTASATPEGRDYFDNDDALGLTLEQFREGFAPKKVVEEKLDAYIRHNTLRVWREGHGCKVIRSTDTAYKYNLMSEEDFKKKHRSPLKFHGYEVEVKDGNLHIGCMAYALGNVRLIEAVLQDMAEHEVSVKDVLYFLGKHGHALGL